jgi:hypothetical protein
MSIVVCDSPVNIVRLVCEHTRRRCRERKKTGERRRETEKREEKMKAEGEGTREGVARK